MATYNEYVIGGNTTSLTWENSDFSSWPLVRIPVIPDGNCFFHALVASFFIPYYTERIDGNYVSKISIIQNLRLDLAKSLQTPGEDGKMPYERLYNGELAKEAKDVTEFTLKEMTKTLASSQSLGYGYLEFVSDELEIDIYILDLDKRDVYIPTTEEIHYLFRNRRSAVLLYNGNHYDLVGIIQKGKLITCFHHSHPFITFLRGRYKK